MSSNVGTWSAVMAWSGGSATVEGEERKATERDGGR